MKKKWQINLDALLQEIGQEETDFTFDREKLEQELDNNLSSANELPLKLLTIFASLLAAAFSFITLLKLLESPQSMLIWGSILLLCSLALIRYVQNIMAETICVAFGLLGCSLLLYGFDKLHLNNYALALIFAAIGLAVILFSGNNLFVFLGTILVSGCLFTLTVLPENKSLVHLYTGLVACLLTFLSLHEARIISFPKLNELYRPVWMGLALSLIGLVFFLTLRDIGTTGIGHVWISSVLLVVPLLFVVFKVLQAAGIYKPLHQGLILLCCALMLAPTVFTPSLPGALLVLLLSFYLGHRAGVVMGVVALGYFIIRFYYDLQLTLLQKSGVLVLTGALFILGYLLLHHYLKRHAS